MTIDAKRIDDDKIIGHSFSTDPDGDLTGFLRFGSEIEPDVEIGDAIAFELPASIYPPEDPITAAYRAALESGNPLVVDRVEVMPNGEGFRIHFQAIPGGEPAAST